MGFFDGLGDVLSNAAKWAIPAAAVGAGVYTTLRAQKARERQNAEYQRFQNEQYQNALSAYNEPMMGGGGAPGLSRKAAEKAKAIYEQRYGEALNLLKPYVDVGTRQLPQIEGVFNQGTAGLSELAKLMLNAQSFANTNQEVPAYKVPVRLPSNLQGGR